jgi:hypothetical protein
MQPGGGAFVVFTRGVHRPRGFTGEDSPTTAKKKGSEKEFKRNTKTVQHEQLDAAAVLRLSLRGVVTRDQHEGRFPFPLLSPFLPLLPATLFAFKRRAARADAAYWCSVSAR